MTTPTSDFDQGRRTPTSTGRYTVASIAARLAGERSTVDTPSSSVRPSEAPTDPANPVGSSGSAPMEPKVKMAGLWSLLGSIGVFVAVKISENPALLGDWLPEWAVAIVSGVAGYVAALWGGWRAPHQQRPGDGFSAPGSPPGGS